MTIERTTKGCTWFVGIVVAMLLGSAFGGIAGMILSKNVYVAVAVAVGGAIISNRAFSAWWKGMANTQRNPVVHVLLFLLMFLALAAGMVFLGRDLIPR